MIGGGLASIPETSAVRLAIRIIAQLPDSAPDRARLACVPQLLKGGIAGRSAAPSLAGVADKGACMGRLGMLREIGSR